MSTIVPIAGVLAFLQSLPPDRWAIVTSAPRELALRRLQCVGITIPDILVTADDVEFGKPDPECYRLGAARLGLEPSDCLVFEDAAAGIAAGEAAACDVMIVAGVRSTVTPASRQFIGSYDDISIDLDENGGMRVKIGS